MTDETDDVRGLLGTYALGVCTPEEAAAVQARLESSPELRHELEALMPVARALLNASAPAPEVGPDDALKRAVMVRVREETQDLSTTQRRATRSRRLGFRAVLRSPVRITALAAVLVAIVVAVATVTSGGGTTKTYHAQITRTLAPHGTAQITVGTTDARLTVTGFPSPGTGRRYQVWLQTGAQAPRPTRVLFTVDAAGHAEATLPVDRLHGVDRVMVTSEPAAGSPAPTTAPILQATV